MVPVIYFLLLFLLILSTLLLQGALAAIFPVVVWPDLLLVVIVSLSFQWGGRRGLLLGFGGGLLQDILLGPAPGLFALAKLLAAFLAAAASRWFYRGSIWGPMFAVIGATIVHEVLIYCLSALFYGLELPVMVVLETIILPKMGYHFFLVLIFYPALCRLDRLAYSRPP